MLMIIVLIPVLSIWLSLINIRVELVNERLLNLDLKLGSCVLYSFSVMLVTSPFSLPKKGDLKQVILEAFKVSMVIM